MAPLKLDLIASARAEMIRQGFQPDMPPELNAAVSSLKTSEPIPAIDLRDLLWSSIDNSSSKDLDQIEWAERSGDAIRVSVAIADVDALVTVGSAIDQYASGEATSVYTPGHVFPMLPEALSTDRTSLAPDQDRAAVVVEMTVGADGGLKDSKLYRAMVRNKAQLTYGRIGAWLAGQGNGNGIEAGLAAQLRLQDEAASRLRAERVRMGALQFDRVEAVTVIEDGQVRGIEKREKNRAADLIEDFMIAANEAMAERLSASGVPAIRRVVKSPERWPRIVELAASYGATLPSEPDPGALNTFLQERQAKDPDRYADISLSVMKLMGPGEYVVVGAGDVNAGHFGLAAHDYTHSTAPNRRFADLVTQRLIKAILDGTAAPYSLDELAAIARNCTLKEDAARKVERSMQKRAAAFALRSRVGQSFRAVITGVTPKGVFARVFDPPVEGRVMSGEKGLDVGDQVRLTLLRTDPEQGFIDFGR